MANSVVKLSIDSQEYDAKLKQAGKALNEYFDIVKKGDATFTQLDDGVLEAVKALGKMETANKSAKGSLSELQRSFTDFSLIYRRFTAEEKASPGGKALAQSLTELKARINDTKKDLEAINQELSGSKFGQFGSVIDSIGHKFGVTANITELLTSKTALLAAGIGAVATGAGMAAKKWAEYNKELARQDQQTNIITGLDGFADNNMTDMMRALSDTYKVDFRQAVEAANTLMSQFGKSGDEAIQLIKDGMRGMIIGDGGKMLQMIQQYAPAFRDAGVSASQLIAVIHNTQGGLFSPENMSAIVMGMKNIRLMTKQTSEALAKLGIDGQQMAKQLNDGTITVFDALKRVASELKNVDSNSQAAGQVMQAVFGRQGAMAGTNLSKAIEELNTNLDETKKKTGEVGDAFDDLQTANERLNVSIRNAFSYDGWEQMAVGIKTTLIETLADVIDKLGTVKGLLSGLTPGQVKTNKYGTGGTPDELQRDLEALKNASKEEQNEMYRRLLQKYESRFASSTYDLQSAMSLHDAGNRGNLLQRYNPLALLGRWYSSTNVNTATSTVQVEEEMLNEFKKKAQAILDGIAEKAEDAVTNLEPKANPQNNTKFKQQTEKETTIRQQITALEKEALTATEERLEEIRKTVMALDQQLSIEKEIRDIVHGRQPALNKPVGDKSGFVSTQLQQFEAAFVDVVPKMSDKNISAFISSLKSEIQNAELGSTLYNNLTAQLADATAFANLLQTAIKNGIDVSQFNPQELWSKIFGQNPSEYLSVEQIEEIRQKLEEILGRPIQLNFSGNLTNDANTFEKAWDSAANAVSKVGNALRGLEDPGAKIGGTIMQAVANIALGFSEAQTRAAREGGPWAWISFAASGLATMLSTISAIKSVREGYAEGGIIKGNSYSGDNIGGVVDGERYVGLNAGELVLTKAMQGSLAAQLSQGGGGGNVNAQPYVSGEYVFLGVSNHLRSTGQGEIVTTSTLRRYGLI